MKECTTSSVDTALERGERERERLILEIRCLPPWDLSAAITVGLEAGVYHRGMKKLAFEIYMAE